MKYGATRLGLILLGTAFLGWWFLTETKKYFGYEFISLATAERRCGVEQFDSERWKAGDEKTRASMVVDLIRSKKYIGRSIGEVRKELGEWEGYFNSDEIPAFIFESKRAGSQDTWQVLFFPDREGRITEVRIHKNCCYDGPFTFFGKLF